MRDAETYKRAEDKHMGAQVNQARRKQQAVSEDAQRIEELVYGRMSSGETDAAGYIDFSVPLFRKYDDAVTSSIYYNSPKLQVKKRKGQKDDKRTLAEVEKRKLEYYVHETDLMYNIALAFCEIRTKGTGFVECFWDETNSRSAIHYAPFSQVLIDPDNENSPRVADLMWMGRERTYGLAAAKERWPKHRFMAVHESPTIPFTETFKIEEDGIRDMGGAGDEIETERVRILAVYLRGKDSANDAPQLANSKPVGEPEEPTWDGSKGADDDDEGDDEGDEKYERQYKGAPQVVYYEICEDGLYLIKQEPLEFVCDDFPLIAGRVIDDPSKFYATSMLLPFYDLARQAESMLRVHASTIHDHAKSVYLLDETEWSDEEAELIKHGPARLVFRKKDILRAQNSFGRLDTGEPKEFVTKSAEMFMNIFRELSSLDALTLGSPGQSRGVERSATGSALLDKRAERLARRYAGRFQEFVDRIFRTMSQIDRSLMTRAQVQKIVGSDIEVTKEIWPNKWDENDIIAEHDVIIEAGSMRYVSEEQRVQDMNGLVDKWIQFIAQVPKMMTELGADATAIMVEKFFNLILREADQLEISNPEEFLPTADELLDALRKKAEEDKRQREMEAQAQAQAAASAQMGMPPGSAQPPVLPPQGTPGPEVPGQLNPQAASQMADMILAGQMDPASAPPEVQAMAAVKLAQAQGGQ